LYKAELTSYGGVLVKSHTEDAEIAEVLLSHTEGAEDSEFLFLDMINRMLRSSRNRRDDCMMSKARRDVHAEFLDRMNKMDRMSMGRRDDS